MYSEKKFYTKVEKNEVKPIFSSLNFYLEPFYYTNRHESSIKKSLYLEIIM